MLRTPDYNSALLRAHELKRTRFSMSSWRSVSEMVLGSYGISASNDIDHFTEEVIRFTPPKQVAKATRVIN